MFKFIRWLMGIDYPTVNASITQEQAIEIAQAEAARQGWEWKERLHVRTSGGCWHVITNSLSKGGNVRILIDQETGEVKDAWWISGERM